MVEKKKRKTILLKMKESFLSHPFSWVMTEPERLLDSGSVQDLPKTRELDKVGTPDQRKKHVRVGKFSVSWQTAG